MKINQEIDELTYVTQDDYNALYLNGQLIREGSFSLPLYLDGKTFSFTHRSYVDFDMEYIAEFDCYPATLKELVEYGHEDV